MKIDVAFQYQSADQVLLFPGNQDLRRRTGRGGRINSTLDGGSVKRLPVTCGSVSGDIEGARSRLRAKRVSGGRRESEKASAAVLAVHRLTLPQGCVAPKRVLKPLSRAKEVEIAAFIGLSYMVEKHTPIAAVEFRRRPFEGCQAGSQFCFTDAQLNPAAGYVKLDFISSANRGERSSYGGFRRGMKHHRAKAGSTHSGVADAHHIVDTLIEQDTGHRDLSPFGKSRGADGAAILHHQNSIFGDREIIAIDLGAHLLDVLEYVCRPAVSEQVRRRRRLLQYRTIRRQIAAQHDGTSFRMKRRAGGADHFGTVALGVRNVLGNRLARNGDCISIKQMQDLLHYDG